jgi:hypothetical protein
VQRQYSWRSAGDQVVDLCRWVLGHAERPASVIVD